MSNVKRSHRFNRVFVVHRLDRETSGLMMYAKDEKPRILYVIIGMIL